MALMKPIDLKEKTLDAPLICNTAHLFYVQKTFNKNTRTIFAGTVIAIIYYYITKKGNQVTESSTELNAACHPLSRPYLSRKKADEPSKGRLHRLKAMQVKNFPQLTKEELIVLALGTYQLKLARSYCSEHLNNGLYTIETYALEDLPEYGIDQNVCLLRGRIRSRHVRARTYYCYVLFSSNDLA
ncbi:unnamed protein product [Chilo suppressalis]|uniref:Uncharacterized protein n=1 Tax=Chilo suppressalis TaxID=168631 RepID=A0ABN8BC14_CHISP|nr:unnamed protein product [Chilo suppressalis]